jgi:hypothetical protein
MDWKLEARIRERAYQIWEREGRPEGRDFDHWTRAVAEVQAEETGGKAASGAAPKAQAEKTGAKTGAKATAKKKVNGAGASPKVAAGAIKKAAKPKGRGTSARS